LLDSLLQESLKMPMVARASMMSLGTWESRSTKYQKFLNLSNVFLLISSTILIFCAILLITWYHMLKLDFWSPYFYWTPMIMLVLGIFTFAVTCYGFIISVRESRGLIMVMAILLGLAFVGQLASVFTVFMLRTTIETTIPEARLILDDMQKYGREDYPEVKENWDSMQSSLRCCGGMQYESGYTSWEAALTQRHVPDSCCHNIQEKCGENKIKIRNTQNVDLGIWKDGCIEILQSMMRKDLLNFAFVYVAIGFILALVELITVVLACAYVAQINRRTKREQEREHMYSRAATADDQQDTKSSQHETNF